jgi:hypothetical protein
MSNIFKISKVASSYVSKIFWSSRSWKTKALKTYGLACQIIIELSKTSLIAVICNFVRKVLSMKMIFTFEQKIFMIESYFLNGHTVHAFRESGSVQRKCST